MIPPGATADHVETRHGRLRVLHAGSPHPGVDPVLLVHGGGYDNSAISWYRLMQPLAEHREVWAVDLPGFGGSIDAPAVGGPAALADVVAATMGAVELDRGVVFGVSMGGDVALNLALREPDRVAQLVLIGPGGLVPRLPGRSAQFWAWAGTRLPDPVLRPATWVANRFARAALGGFVKDVDTLPAEVVEEFVREARRPGAGLAYGRYNQATIGRHGMTNDLTDRVAGIAAPTLFFHGADDPLVDPQGSVRAAGLMPRAEMIMVPDCGHWAQLEAHDRFLSAVEEFLGVTGGRAARGQEGDDV